MDAYTELTEKIGKLQRNEMRMTAKQKTQYASQLSALRERISVLAIIVMWRYMLKDVALGNDGDDAGKRIKKIFSEELDKGIEKRALNALFSSYSTDEFLKVLSPAQCRVFYEGYGPYFASHCKPVKEKDNAADVSYYNDIIGMYWVDDMQVWKRKGMWKTAVMLPPTMELISAEYKAVKSEMTGGFDESR